MKKSANESARVRMLTTPARPIRWLPRIGEALRWKRSPKGYEGYAAAATDLIERARKIYPTVESLTVRIDNFSRSAAGPRLDQRRPWEWAHTDTVRVTFEGRNLTQAASTSWGKRKTSSAWRPKVKASMNTMSSSPARTFFAASPATWHQRAIDGTPAE